jgi:hypothetical protein
VAALLKVLPVALLAVCNKPDVPAIIEAVQGASYVLAGSRAYTPDIDVHAMTAALCTGTMHLIMMG